MIWMVNTIKKSSMKTAKFFKEAEFKKCTPSCSMEQMDQRTLNKLDFAREMAGIPFVLNSAYRSPEWDKKKGRSGDGAHTKGRAVDIRCNTNENRMRIVLACLSAGFRRIGVAKTYIHVDDDPSKKQNIIWLY